MDALIDRAVDELTDPEMETAFAEVFPPEPRYGYGDGGHKFDPDRHGRCRKASGGYCDGASSDPMHDLRNPS